MAPSSLFSKIDSMRKLSKKIGLVSRSALEAKEYSSLHRTRDFFGALEASLLKERPKDPLKFLSSLLEKMTNDSSDELKGSKIVKSSKASNSNFPRKRIRPRTSFEISKKMVSSLSEATEVGEPLSTGCFVNIRSEGDWGGLKRSLSLPAQMAKLKSFDDLPYEDDTDDLIVDSAYEGKLKQTLIKAKKFSAKLDSGHHVNSVGRISKPLLLREATNNFHLKSYVGCDIGGTLCKITFFEPFNCQRQDIKRRNRFLKSSTTYGLTGRRDPHLEIERWGGRFHFLVFETSHLDGAVSILKNHSCHHEFANRSVPVTGGGAYKYERFLQDELKMGVHKVDELTCLLTGVNFALTHVPDECFYLEHKTDGLPTRRPHSMVGVFPYLLVNIGSGVSILRVDSDKEFKRVGGSCVGGGTYWGLCRLLLGAQSFKEAMQMANEGNHHNVDMTVGDIYGGDYRRFNLKANTVASAFGKLVMQENCKVSKADAAASLLHMIGANIAQLAFRHARENNISRILFAGNFLRMNMTSAIFISSSINYWSQGKTKALFLRHEGYFGSLGALLMSKDTSMDNPRDSPEKSDKDFGFKARSK
eukprot:CAMPEP_0167770016 /NCGR_PEP_ID=MMETSP0110_2-20121227/17662_1 /TAXON_ID=629695 /ORGANISM="Gymnochlora sp., Strain CCMP2014" /LENGTH=587 /DNA_ID=CAMNT_0007659101 /DNA_START=24 /DNA_END=1787 /DNA_ORIENTATION=-